MNNIRSQSVAQFGRHFSALGFEFQYSEAASQAQSSAQGGKVGKRPLVLSLTDDLMQLKRTATYIIENAFESDVAALASWKSASHVEVPPKKKAPPTP